MAVNKRYLPRISDNAPSYPIIRVLNFNENSQYYHQEEWREITDWIVPTVRPGCYFISNYGRVFSRISSTLHPNGTILSPSINQKGYYQIDLRSTEIGPNNKPRRLCCKIHRLVLMAFGYIPGCEFLEVDHIDDDSSNNTIWNLQWITPRENTRKAVLYGDKNISLDSTGGRFLTDQEAQAIFNEAVNINYSYELDIIADKYNVSRNFVKSIRNGAVRPYYKREFINNGGTIETLKRI